VAISKARVCKFSEKHSQPQESFEVSGSASLYPLATSTTFKAYLYVFRPGHVPEYHVVKKEDPLDELCWV